MKKTSTTTNINNYNLGYYYNMSDLSSKSSYYLKRNKKIFESLDIEKGTKRIFCNILKIKSLNLNIVAVAMLLFTSSVALAGTGDKVTVTGGATTAAGANGDYFYAGTTNVGGTVRDYYDMPSSVYRIEYRNNPSYGNEWEVWESTDRGGSGTVRFFNASSAAIIPTGTWTLDVGSGTPVISFTAAPVASTITTQAVSSITATTATGNGNITSLGSPNPTAYGVCWNTGGTPTTSDYKVDKGAASATGAFTGSITGLTANTTYYVRAYATNTAGTSYGSQVSFTTSSVAATVTTQAVTSIAATTAAGNGNITSLGAPNPTAHGVCWNTGGTPTISDSKVDNGAASATGAYAASMTSLTANTTYYVRAYATNSAGTSYGSQVSFTTSPVAPTVTTQAVSSIAATTATGNGNITSLGAPNPTAYGVCWNTGGTPTTSDSKVDNGATSSTGAFTASITGLTANTLYHVRAYATNTAGTSYGSEVTFTTLTAGTFTGNTSTDWGTSTNWAGGSVPSSSTDVTIPTGKTAIIAATTRASCNNLTVTGSLTIASTSSGTGSLIVSGTSTGFVACQRYMTNGKWHLISPIASGQTVADFLTANTNIPTSGSTRGMMDYNTLGNSWNPYYPTTSALGTMDAGKGYSSRIASTDGTITFTGTLATGTKTVALTTTGQGWNCVGNPYTSSINMNTTAHATNNFITVNSSNLDASYACIYVWDEDATYTGQNCYKVICNSGFSTTKTILAQNYVAPGQGFFVKAKTSATDISFTSAMQSQELSTPFRAPVVTTSWPGIVLNAVTSDASSSAIITFNENMTNGLDPTYDAGLLRGTNGLSLYTRLLLDNGVDFAIQCLPENYNNLVIPVGVDFKEGGEINFSAETVNLPVDCNVILEDRTTKTFTSLAAGATYKTTVSAGSTAVGRFYIRTAADFTTATSGLTAGINKLKAYTVNGKIIIEGEISDQAIATLYDLQGLIVLVHQLQKGTFNTLLCPELMNGVYLLTIQQNGETMTRKLIMK